MSPRGSSCRRTSNQHAAADRSTPARWASSSTARLRSSRPSATVECARRLRQRADLLGHREALPHAAPGGDRVAQRALLERPAEQERECRNPGGHDEHRRQRLGERVDVGRVNRRRQPAQRRRVGVGDARRHAAARRRRQGGRELGRQPVGEDRAEHRGADRPADRAKQGGARRGHAEVGVVDGVLDREHQHLHHRARSPGRART